MGDHIISKKEIEEIKHGNDTWYKLKIQDLRGERNGFIKSNDAKVSMVSAHDWTAFGFKVLKDQPDNFIFDAAEKNAPQFLQSVFKEIDTNGDKKLSPNELRKGLNDMYVCERMSKLVCYHQSEWGVNYSSLKQEIETLLDKGIEKEEDKEVKELYKEQKEEILKITQGKVNALDFWSKVKVPGDEMPEGWTYDPILQKSRKMYSWETQSNPQPRGENDLEPFPTDTKVYHFHPNAFVEQMRRLRPCSCPVDEPLFKCSNTRYGIGPVYWGHIKLSAVKAWDEIDKVYNTVVSDDEKKIIIAMAKNEGSCDTIQAYDSAILTVGAMQKIVGKDGRGEFSTQVFEFKEKYPQKYKILFENCGWTVEKEDDGIRMYYESSEGKTTGTKLRALVREGFDANSLNQNLPNEPLAHLIKVGKDEDFIRKQVYDFILRIRKYCDKKPNGYSYQIKEYFNSPLGKAIVLDHSVNAPGNVTRDVGVAITTFFNEKDTEIIEFNKTVTNVADKKSKISRNPNDWGSNHVQYENRILELYGPVRDMNDAKDRYDKIKKEF